MDTKANYTVVGIFVIALGVMLVIFIMWLTSLQHREVYDVYIVYMHEEVSGLGPQGPVRYNGVKVGYVDSIWLNPQDAQQVVLKLKVRHGTPVTTSTVATLMSEGITGIAYVGLKALTSQAPPLRAKPGEKYPIIPSEPSLLLKLSTALEDVTKTIKSLTDSVNKVFSDSNRQAISASLENIATVTKTVANNSKNIDSSLQSMSKLLDNGEKASQRLPVVMQELESTLAAFKQLAVNFSAAGRNVSITARDTRTAMQNVSQQLVPSAQQLFDQLNTVAGNLQQISSQLQRNPSILVRGQNPPLPGPGEKRR